MSILPVFRVLCLITVLLASVVELSAQATGDEKTKIEALISHIEGLQDATFIRNGKEYSSANAAKFLRAKWNRDDTEVKTVEDFISKVASASGSSGKPYLIRLKDGKEVACAEYLKSQLTKQTP